MSVLDNLDAATMLGQHTGAAFSDCRYYRYLLWRSWDLKLPMANLIMLNPSIADGEINDPTIVRVTARVKAANFGSFVVTNAYSYIATDPATLKRFARRGGDPIGPRGNAAIMSIASRAKAVVVAWGSHIDQVIPGRQAAIYDLLRGGGITWYTIGMNEKSGTPKHPLFVGYDIKSPIGI